MPELCATKPLKSVDGPPYTTPVFNFRRAHPGLVGDISVQSDRDAQAQCETSVGVSIVLSVQRMGIERLKTTQHDDEAFTWFTRSILPAATMFQCTPHLALHNVPRNM